MKSLGASDANRGPSRLLAAAMALVFMQGIVSTFLHFDVESHYFCVEHQRITHDGDHARQAYQNRQTSVAAAPSDHDGQPSEKDDRRQSEDCLWLT